MTQHFVPVHSMRENRKSEESQLSEFDRDLPSILAPAASFGPYVNITGNPLPRIENRPDLKIVHVNGGVDALINGDDKPKRNDTSSRGTIFAALVLFLSALFNKIFDGFNRCRPVNGPPRQQEASFSAVELERIEEELRKTPKKTQKPNAPVY
ncbi:hypothetical protein BIW11_11590 [Tropilaelaps mercedesae]|uniref:Uncharacterized protein n=1 Tax=Tropilaelaps mercedesae TaxID=418985 RepID=A0A1V9XAE1_9ACAR|nr:hypothetical protein BIW11_11590 [Tropilaelaps mercedesae]